MEFTELLAFLALIVALSSYAGAMRLALIGRLSATPPPAAPSLIRIYLLGLTLADVFLVIAGVLLVILIWPRVPCENMLCTIRTLFVIALGFLVLMHAVAWVVTAAKLFK
jgi:hypothetical protein